MEKPMNDRLKTFLIALLWLTAVGLCLYLSSGSPLGEDLLRP